MDRAISKLWVGPVFGLGFVAYACASLFWTKGDVAYPSLYLLSLVACFLIGWRMSNVSKVWGTFLIGVIGLNLVSWLSPVVINPNYLGDFLAIAIAGAIAYEMWIFLPFGFIALYLTRSREAILAVGLVCFFGLFQRSRFTALVLALGATLLIVTQKNDIALSVASRLGVWQDTINHLVPFGHGFGSFLDEYKTFAFRTNAGGTYFPHAYNDYLELISDLGLGVIFLWASIICAWENDNTRAKLILLTFATLSLVYFPLWIIGLGHIGAFTFGHLSNPRNNRKILWPLRSV